METVQFRGKTYRVDLDESKVEVLRKRGFSVHYARVHGKWMVQALISAAAVQKRNREGRL